VQLTKSLHKNTSRSNGMPVEQATPLSNGPELESLSLNEEPKLPVLRPRLQRVDGKPLRKDDLERRRFGITIQSVYYYNNPSSRSICCAVLLKTHFLLKPGDKLASALVPLSTRPSRLSTQDTKSIELGKVDISEYFPETTEYAHVAQLSGSRDTYGTPCIKTMVLGTGIEVSGVGINKHRLEEKSFTITLDPVLNALGDHPTYLEWNFQDKQGIFYPPSVNVLVIVEKSTNERELWFPFELNLECTLKVAIHDGPLKYLSLNVKPTQHAGWCFQIKGKYKSDVAKDALEDAKKKDMIPSVVGLRAAVKPWIDAQSSTGNNSRTTAEGLA